MRSRTRNVKNGVLALGFALGAVLFFSGLPANGQGPGQAAPPNGGTCGPGQVCKPAALQTKCIATGSLPTCNASRLGQVRCDSTRDCTARCQSDAGWACEGSTVTTSELTATAPLVLYDDGGTVNLSVGITQYSASIDVGSIAELNCLVTSINSIPNVVLEAGDTCDVGFALSSTGGAPQTTWDCWPSDVNAARLRTCCVAGVGGGACDPASQTLYFTFTCPDGSCQ